MSLLSLLMLSACAKPSGFRVEDLTFETVKNKNLNKDKASPAEEVPAPGTIVRNSNRIAFQPKKSEWDDQKLTLTADVKVGEESFGEVQFKGEVKDSKVLLTPVNPDLQNKVKAQLICTSEGNCDEFFVDVFYNQKDVLYHDQVIAEFDSAVKKSATENKGKPTKVQPPVTTNKNTKKPTVGPVKKTEAEEEIIGDEIEAEAESQSGYVGTSDEDARAAFQIKAPPKAIRPQPGVNPKEEKKEELKEQQKETPQAAIETYPPGLGEMNPAAPTQIEPAQTDLAAIERLKVRDQIIGKPDGGSLAKGTNFEKLAGIAGFNFALKPLAKNFYGSFDLARLLYTLGEALQKILPGHKLVITEISRFGGGRLCFVRGGKTVCHSSHQNGQDADIRYLGGEEHEITGVEYDAKTRRSFISPHFLPAEQWKFFKMAFATEQTELIFIDSRIKKLMCQEARRSHDFVNGQTSGFGYDVLSKLYEVKGHETHFHVRVKCSEDNPRCKKIDYAKKRDLGC